MKKKKLLISALCVSMAVTQLPMGVFAEVDDASESVTDIIEMAQTESEEIFSEKKIEETEKIAQDEELRIEKTDAVEADGYEDEEDKPDYSQYDIDHIVKIEMTDASPYGNDANIYTLDYTDVSRFGRQFYGVVESGYFSYGDTIALIDPESDKATIKVIPWNYHSGYTYGINALINGSADQDISDKVVSNGDGSYSLEISKGQAMVSITAKATDAGMDLSTLFAGGTGSETDPFLISDDTQLRAMNDVPFENMYFKLTEDVDCAEKAWVPVKSYNWHFDGDGKTIKNLTILQDRFGDAAIFAQGGFVKEVKNLIIENVSFSILNPDIANTQTMASIAMKACNVINCTLKGSEVTAQGGMAGLVYDVVSDGSDKVIFSGNTNEADINATRNVAGLAYNIESGSVSVLECVDNENKGNISSNSPASGLFWSIAGINPKNTVDNCTNNGTVTGSYAAGIVYHVGNSQVYKSNEGRYFGKISGCNNTGCITSLYGDGYWGAQGIISGANGEMVISHCVNSGEINCPKATAVGIMNSTYSNGLPNKITVIDCANTGKITADSPCGIVSELYEGVSIENCYNSGDLISTSEKVFVYPAGITQYMNEGTIKNCFNTGTIDVSKSRRKTSDEYSTVGGLVGCLTRGVIENSYNIGEIKNTNMVASSVASLSVKTDQVSYWEKTITISGCYYLKSGDLTGVLLSDGKTYSKFSATGLTGKSLAKQASFKNWDFNNTWQIGNNENYPYPELKDNPYVGPKVEVDQSSGTDDPQPDNPDKPQPEPDKPVEVQTGGTYVVNQKFNVTSEGFLGQSYAKYEVVPKGAATVKNGLVTVKKVPADGKVTIYGLVKSGSKWVKDKAFEFTSEKPVLPKTVSFTVPYDENINPDDDNARILVSSLVSGTSVVPTAWTPAKSAIADYDAEKGIIYAKSKGSTKVTAVFGDPASTECAKYTFTVKVNVPKISKSALTLQSGAGQTLKISGAAKGAKITWESSDPEYVSVDASTGKVTALKYNAETEGKATIQAAINGVEFPAYACEVTVPCPKLKITSFTLAVNKSAKLVVQNTKFNTKAGGITFESSDKTIADVDANGKITGIAPGECTITVKVAGIELTCPVEVR